MGYWTTSGRNARPVATSVTVTAVLTPFALITCIRRERPSCEVARRFEPLTRKESLATETRFICDVSGSSVARVTETALADVCRAFKSCLASAISCAICSLDRAAAAADEVAGEIATVVSDWLVCAGLLSWDWADAPLVRSAHTNIPVRNVKTFFISTPTSLYEN